MCSGTPTFWEANLENCNSNFRAKQNVENISKSTFYIVLVWYGGISDDDNLLSYVS